MVIYLTDLHVLCAHFCAQQLLPCKALQDVQLRIKVCTAQHRSHSTASAVQHDNHLMQPAATSHAMHGSLHNLSAGALPSCQCKS